MNYHYECACGHDFDANLGMYGCPNCEGTSGAALLVADDELGGDDGS